MASNQSPIFVDGVWGPYYSAMVPGLWLTEGGQSAAGAAIDHLVTMHPASAEAQSKAEAAGLSLVAWLDRQASDLCSDPKEVVTLAKSIHVVPEFLGNRSPHADPDARAVIAGLGLENDISDLVSLYIAGLCGIGYGLKQLIETLAVNGIRIDTIVASGGAAQSNLVRQLLADTTHIPVAVTDTDEPVLLGAAMLGALASGRYQSLDTAMQGMSRFSQVFAPAGSATASLHGKRYEAFERLQRAEREVRALFAETASAG
jgi:FGGY-family pentulose kinase